MKTIHKTSKFKKDFKQYKNDNKVKIKLDEALSYLECGKELPASFKNHPLQGKYKGSFDCHLYPDVVLIYAISNDSISLSRIGKHNKLELTETLKLHIREEFLNGVDYLFRGESNNNYQQNYSKKVKLPFTSRFYAYEIFEGIPLFGNVAVYELSNSANMWNYDDSVESFIEEFDLLSYAVPELYKVYKITTLSELKEYGGTITFDYHDFYHAHQLVAIAYLENNYKTKYDGINWYEANDTPETQCMIWNDNVVRKLSYKEAKQVIADIANKFDFDTIYRNTNEYGDKLFNLAKK